MKNFINAGLAVLAMFVAVDVSAYNQEQALVVDVTPNYRTKTTYETKTFYEEQCFVVEEKNRGLIERANNGVFGSLEGTIGTGIGVAIGSEIGGGKGNDAAKILGGIIGNKIGNDIGDRNRIARGETECATVPVTVQEPRTETFIKDYSVTVKIENSHFKVTRNNKPTVGSYIPVSLTVR